MRLILTVGCFLSGSIAEAIPKEIRAAAIRHSVDAKLLHAIWLVESGGRTTIKPSSNPNGTKDYGPFQINTINLVKCRGLNVETLAGGARCASRLLERYSEATAWSYARYHSKTPSLRAKYANKLTAALARR
jgi:hypothetical protein